MCPLLSKMTTEEKNLSFLKSEYSYMVLNPREVSLTSVPEKKCFQPGCGSIDGSGSADRIGLAAQ